MKKKLHLIALAFFNLCSASKKSLQVQGRIPFIFQHTAQLMRSYAGALLLVACAFSAAQGQQQPGAIDHSFNAPEVASGGGFNHHVNSIVLQADGKFIVGGEFANYNGALHSKIVRLLADGTPDGSFNTGSGFSSGAGNSYVSSIILQPDGKLVVIGGFNSYNGIARNNIARLHADGSLDNSFNPGTGFNSGVKALALQSDGKLIVGGSFSFYNGVSVRNIIRIETDGTLDNTFDPGTGFDGYVEAVALEPNGKVVVGGTFNSFNGVSRGNIARLNPGGTLDDTFNSGTGFTSTISEGSAPPEASVYAIVPQSDGKVVVGGRFTAYNGTTRHGIARLDVDGSMDLTFEPVTILTSDVEAVAVQPDGKIVMSGTIKFEPFSYFKRVARLHADGSLDNSFSPGFYEEAGFNSSVKTIALQPDGMLLMGGLFTEYNNTTSKFLARLHTNGTLENSFTPVTGFNQAVTTIALQTDGKVVAIGRFTSYSGTTRNRIARLYADGSLDNAFDPGTGFDNSVTSLALQQDGKILVGGRFTSYNGAACKGIVRLHADGSLDTSFNPETGASEAFLTFVIHSEGSLYVAERTRLYNTGDPGYPSSKISRLLADGSRDESFIPDPQLWLEFEQIEIATQSDGKLVVIGTAYHSQGHVVVRLNTDGSRDTSFTIGVFSDPTYYSRFSVMVLQNDDKIIVGGGNFTHFHSTPNNSTPRSGIGRLNANGTLDTSFDPGTGFDTNSIPYIYAIAEQNDGKLLVGGLFSSYNGTARVGLIRLNTDGSLDPSFIPEFKGATSIVLQPDGKVLVAAGNRIVRMHGGEVLSTEKDLLAVQDVQVYPNPSRGDVNLALSGAAASGAVRVVLYNAMGKQTLSREVAAGEAQSGMTLSTSALASGVYFLNINTRGGSITKRLVLTQ